MKYKVLKVLSDESLQALQNEVQDIRECVEQRKSTPMNLLARVSAVDRELHSLSEYTDARKDFLACYSENPLADLAKSLTTKETYQFISEMLAERIFLYKQSPASRLYKAEEVDARNAERHKVLSALDMLHKFMQGQCPWREHLTEDATIRLKHNLNNIEIHLNFQSSLLIGDKRLDESNRDEIYQLITVATIELVECFCADHGFNKMRLTYALWLGRRNEDNVSWSRLSNSPNTKICQPMPVLYCQTK